MSTGDHQVQSIPIDEADIPKDDKELSYIAVHPTSSRNGPAERNNLTNTFDSLGTTGVESEPVVTRKEIWSYYLYYNGNNGIGVYNLTPTLLQLLATSAGYDPAHGPGSSCLADNASDNCVIPWGNGTKSVTSMILLTSGIGFAILTVTFTTICSFADYGNIGRRMLLVFTFIFMASQFAWLGLTVPSRWPAAMALNIIGFICYGTTTILYTAVFPRFARNTRRSKLLRGRYESGEITKEEYATEKSIELNRICSISTMHNYVGFILGECLCISVLVPLKDNPLDNNYTIVLTNGYFIITGIWWFIFQQRRPGPPLPKGENYCTVGWKQLWVTLKTYRQLPNTFIYIVASFLLADAANTTYTLVSIIQNDKIEYSFLQNAYFGLVQAGAIFSIMGMWYSQSHLKLSTKKMVIATGAFSFLVPLWGMLGIWTKKIGFHNIWEFWAYNVIYGMFQLPYFAFAQTMMAELTPPGFENLFFGLYGFSTRVSSMIGPYIVQGIVDKTGNNWMGFPFLFAMCAAALIMIWFGVDMQKGYRDAVEWEKYNATSIRARREK